MSGGGEMKAKGKREESGLSGLALALQNASPRAKGHRARGVPHLSQLGRWPLARRRGAVKWKRKGSGLPGLALAFQHATSRAKGHRARGIPIYPNLGVGLWRGGVGVVPCSSQRRLRGLPSAALCRASPFPNERDWDSPPRPAERVAMSVPPSCPVCPHARLGGRLLRCVRLHPR